MTCFYKSMMLTALNLILFLPLIISFSSDSSYFLSEWFPPFILLIAENSVNNISLWVGRRLENDGQYTGSLQGGQEFCSLWFPPPLKQCLAYRWCSINTCYQGSSQVLQRQRRPRSFPIFHFRQKADVLKDDYKAIWKKIKKWYCDRTASENWTLQLYVIFNVGKTCI